MRHTSRLWTMTALILLLAGMAGAQSVADVARKTRKENTKKHPVKVYTNDDLHPEAPLTITGQPAGSAQPASTAAAAAQPSANAGQNGDDNKSAAEKRNEDIKQWKQRFADQKKQIELLQREYDVLQGEYRLRAAAYYADAGNALRNQAGWAKQDRDYREKLDAKQKQLNEARQKLDDMQEAARRAGMPSSVSD